ALPSPGEVLAMVAETLVHRMVGELPLHTTPRGEPCLLVLFGASGDLTKRLLVPALFNLACDGLLPERFALVGFALDELTSDQFRARMTEDIRQFTTRPTFDEGLWNDFVSRFYYLPGNFGDQAAYQRLLELVGRAQTQHQTGDNLICYLATPPSVFGLIASQ